MPFGTTVVLGSVFTVALSPTVYDPFLDRRGKGVAVLVSMQDAELLEQIWRRSAGKLDVA